MLRPKPAGAACVDARAVGHGSTGGMARPRQLRRESTLDGMEVERWAQRNSQRRVAAEHFKDGSLIKTLAVEHCELFGQLFHEKRAVFPPRELLLGSACTGSASEVVAAHYFQRAANAVSPGFRIRPVFTCEIKKEKRKWIAGVHEAFQDACAPSANASAAGQGLASGHSVTSGQASSPVRAMLGDGPSCILSPYGWSGIEQAEVHCLGGEWDAITSELPEKRTDAQEAETYSGETVERSTAPVDHQIPSCDTCGADTYELACEGCGIRFCQVCDNLADCACPPGTGRYRGPSQVELRGMPPRSSSASSSSLV